MTNVVAVNGYDPARIEDGVLLVSSPMCHNIALAQVGAFNHIPAPSVQQLADLASTGLFTLIEVRDHKAGRSWYWRDADYGVLIAQAQRFRVADIVEAIKVVQG